MQHALNVLTGNSVEGDEFYIPRYYLKLLAEENFAVSPKQIEAKWGKPKKKKKEDVTNDLTDEMQPLYTYSYPQFDLQIEKFDTEWLVWSLSTSTKGFGFAGVYVGVPECNKEFITKLFTEAIHTEKNIKNGIESWYITLEDANHTDVIITFDENEIVQKVLYGSGIYIM